MSQMLISVPNQPLYVYTIKTTTITMRGYVRGNNRFGAIGMHGHIIYGVQSIVPMYPSTVTKMPEKIFFYGYPLYSWFGRTLYGGTRFRIPFIIWIWNYIVSGINVYAQVGQTDQAVHVTAQACDSSTELNESFLLVNTADALREARIAFTIEDIPIDIRAVIHACLSHQISRPFYLTAYPHAVKLKETFKATASLTMSHIQSTYKALVVPTTSYIKNTIKTEIVPTKSVLNRMIKAAVSLAQPNIDKQIAVQIDTGESYIARSVKLLTSIGLQAERSSIKIQASLRQPVYHRVVKVTTALQEGLVEQIKIHASVAPRDLIQNLKLIVRPMPAIVERTLHILSRTIPATTIRTLKVMVHPRPAKIDQVLSFIRTNLVKRVRHQNLSATAYIQHKTEQGSIVSYRAHRVVANRSYSKFDFAIEKENKQTLRADFSFESLRQIQSVVVTRDKVEQSVDVKAMALRIIQKIDTRIRLLEQQKQNLLVDFNILPILAERNIRIFPQNAPLIKQVDMMVGICKTHVLAYLNFVADEYIESVDMLLSTCSQTTATLLQWYLHGGEVTNEGGNEIIFDLGDVDPVGPIPAVPSRQWSGGYVEDPFKGVSYMPAGDSTGYGSPAADSWVSNTQMWWNNTSDPWVVPD